MEKTQAQQLAALCSGSDAWHIGGKDTGVPEICVTDGPHGVRKSRTGRMGVGDNLPATCFPAACATACSFDPELLEEMGRALGEECLAAGVAVLLGPGVNIKRSPLCGRNFEYFSEDPLVASSCAAALVRGIQSTGVGACLKHYAANNQESARLVSDSVVDERALREIYLAAFEGAVKDARPATVMCAYNKVNGVYACENKQLLTDILRGEWGFDGLVMTDWGAMNDRVAALNAGLDVEMPGPAPHNDALAAEAAETDDATAASLEATAARVKALCERGAALKISEFDEDAHHALAARIAAESAVLLKNDGLLPLTPDKKLAVIGGFFRAPRYQGAGSSQITPTALTSAHDAFDGVEHVYAEGFGADETALDETKLREAVDAAKGADAAVIFAGLPASFESEGFDREHLELPACQLRVIEAVAATGTPTAVVLSQGAATLLPFADDVSAILLMHLAGQNFGEAARDLLFGKQSPSGRLAETYPLSLDDCPSTQGYGARSVQYRESIYVGYRWFDKADVPVRYPFGHGLTYTTFEYSGLRISRGRLLPGDDLTVTIRLKNTGRRAGKEVVQVYVGAPQTALFMPVRALAAFEKVALGPGESCDVRLTLPARAFQYWNTKEKRFCTEGGRYEVSVGASSRDFRLRFAVTVQGDGVPVPDLRAKAPSYYSPQRGASFSEEEFAAVYGGELPKPAPIRPFTPNSTLRDLMTTRLGRIVFFFLKGKMRRHFLASGMGGAGAATASDVDRLLDAMVYDMPLRGLGMATDGAMGMRHAQAVADIFNGHPIRGAREFLKR